MDEGVKCCKCTYHNDERGLGSTDSKQFEIGIHIGQIKVLIGGLEFWHWCSV